MNFKDMLNKISQLSEATDRSEPGKVKHTAEPGGYGRKDDEDDEGKKVKADAPKRGRGRPKKGGDETGEVKKYDWSAFGGDKKVKLKPWDKSKTKKHSLKEWVEEVEQKYVAEMVPPGMKPLAIMDPKNQSAGAGVVTSKNPAIQKMLGGLDPKDVQIVMTQQGQQPAGQQQQQSQAPMAQGAKPMAEEGDKWIQKAIKHPGALTKKAKAAGQSTQAFAKKHAHDKGTTGKQARLAQTLRGLKKEEAGEMDEMIDVDTLNQLASHAVNTFGHGGAGLAAAATGAGIGGAIAGAGKKAIDYYYKKKEQKALDKSKQGVSEGDLPPQDGLMGAGLGAGRNQATFEGKKPDFLDVDKDKNKKESWKKAEQDKKKKTKVKESMDTRLKAAHHRGKAHALSKEGYNCRYDDMEEARMYHEGYKQGLDECYGQMPVLGQVVGEEGMPPATVSGMADSAMNEATGGTVVKKASEWLRDPSLDAQVMKLQVPGIRITDPTKGLTSGSSDSGGMSNPMKDDWTDAKNPMYFKTILTHVLKKLGDVSVTGVLQSGPAPAMDEGNAFTRALAKTPQGGKFNVAGKTFTDRSGYDATVDETMFESWNNELSSLLEEYDTIQEGMTVSISKGQQGAPDSVSVTAQDQEADQLLQVIKSAGLGLFGDDAGAHGQVDGQSSPMSLQPTDGGEVEGDIDVVDDHDGMMALIKKVTGGAGQPDTSAIGGDEGSEGGEEGGQDYEDEEGHEEEHDHDHDEDEKDTTDESTCEGCGMEESQCGCDNEQVDEVESEDQMEYEVAEDNAPDSGAAEEQEEIEDTAQANASAADHGGADDNELDESEQLEEWANEAGQRGTDQAFEADIAFMTKVISGGLNRQKATGQTTTPVIAGQNDRMGYEVNESISDWKKLAGLK